MLLTLFVWKNVTEYHRQCTEKSLGYQVQLEKFYKHQKNVFSFFIYCTEKRDFFVNLPTNFGKSVVFQALRYYIKHKSDKNFVHHNTISLSKSTILPYLVIKHNVICWYKSLMSKTLRAKWLIMHGSWSCAKVNQAYVCSMQAFFSLENLMVTVTCHISLDLKHHTFLYDGWML